MVILKFLQQNAEWMCAIAIVFFSAMQCWLAHQQNMQNIRMKRLKLANKLDKICSNFSADKNHAAEITKWLIENSSNFVFLLKNKDRTIYKNLLLFLMDYNNSPKCTITQQIEIIKKFNLLLGELNLVLGNANYGFVNDKTNLKK